LHIIVSHLKSCPINSFLRRVRSEHTTHHEAYDVSESESEDEDAVPRPISSAPPSETSSITTLENQGHILAIEADPRREKAFKIAVELLTTERSYVAVLHLIDQVIIFHIKLASYCVKNYCFSVKLYCRLINNASVTCLAYEKDFCCKEFRFFS
jgi:hypothetical protein